MMVMDKALNFRANIDIKKPLHRGMMIRIKERPFWIEFKYLKLLDFYY